MNYERIEAAAKGAFPELWPDNTKELGLDAQAALTYQRQHAIDRMVAGLAAYDEVPEHVNDYDAETVAQLKADEEAHQAALAAANEPEDPGLLEHVVIELPGDAAMIQQTLTVITYIDEGGRTAHAIKFSGDGQRTSWLGMCVLAQNYILNLPGTEN